jgi:CBS domain-containing protein
MRIEQLMSRPAVTVHVNDPLNLAAQRMWDHDIGALVVVNDEGKLAGMITDRDICMAALTQSRALDELLVNIAMAKHVVAATPDQSIGDIEHLMAVNQIRRLPIVDTSKAPVGVISLNDLAIESVQPDTRMQQGVDKVVDTLAAICRHRGGAEQAA